MKVVKKNVYYCDYCKKRSLSPNLKIHENHCTANPDRSCRMCEGGGIREIIDKDKKYFYLRKIIPRHPFADEEIQVAYRKKFTLQDLRSELEYECPNCLLALIRCLGLNRYYFGDKFKFDYKEELGEWWAAENKSAYEEAERETYAYDGY